MVGALWPFWATRGHLAEGRRWLTAALAASAEAPVRARIAAMHGASVLAAQQGDNHTATSLAEEMLALAQAHGDSYWVARSLIGLGDMAADQGDFQRATPLMEEALGMFRELGQTPMVANGLLNLGRTLVLGYGDYERATPLLEESLALCRQLGDQTGIIYALLHLAFVALIAREVERGIDQCTEALQRAWASRNQVMIAYCLDGMGCFAVVREQTTRAVRLFGAAEQIRMVIGAPMAASERKVYEPWLAAARGQLDSAAFAAAWAAGQAMTVEQSVAYALDADITLRMRQEVGNDRSGESPPGWS
jgi:non-specific serine/threonine protein kinase